MKVTEKLAELPFHKPAALVLVWPSDGKLAQTTVSPTLTVTLFGEKKKSPAVTFVVAPKVEREWPQRTAPRLKTENRNIFLIAFMLVFSY